MSELFNLQTNIDSTSHFYDKILVNASSVVSWVLGSIVDLIILANQILAGNQEGTNVLHGLHPYKYVFLQCPHFPSLRLHNVQT